MKQNLLFNRASAICKRLAMVLTMLLVVGVGQAWGADYELVTSAPSDWSGEYLIVAGTSALSGGTSSWGTTTTVTVSNNKISTTENISVTISKGGTSGTYYIYMNSNSKYLKEVTSNTFATADASSTDTEWKISLSNGNAQIACASATTRYLRLNGTSGYRCYTSATGTLPKLYKKAASYTITAKSNNASYGTVSLSGKTITATPATGYRVSTTTPYTISPSGSATVTQNGNTFTVTPSANTTITINFEALPKYTVTLKDDNSTLTQSTAGATITLPSRDGCDGYEFVGWTKSWSVAQTTWTTTAPTIIPAGSYTPTADESLYPVYTKTTEGANEETKTITLSPPTTTSGYKEGTKTDSEGNTWSYYAAINNQSGTFEFGLNSNALNYNIGSPIFDGKVSSVSFKARNGSSSESRKFLFCSTNTTAQPTTGDLAEVSIPKSQQFTNIYTADLSQSNISQFYIYAPKALGITAISVTYTTSTSGSTTSYISVPDCITETTVSLNPNGGTGSMVDVTTQNGTLTLPECTFTREGYTFAGWATSASGEVAFADEEVVSNWDADITELFAKWTAKTITITWNLNYTGATSTTSSYTYDGATITPPTPTRTGYSFNGWFTATTGGTKITEVGTTNKPTENVTYYAQWTAKTITITWNLNYTGATSTTSSYTYDGAAIALPTPTRTGYSFNGWFTAASGGTKITEVGTTNKPTENVTYYAQWTAKPLTNYRTFCDVVCDAYSFHTGTGEKETWSKEAIKCFTEAEGGYEHEWQIKDYIIPVDDKFFVGNYGYFYNDNLGSGVTNGKSRSVVSDWGNMYLAPAMDENDAPGTPRLGHAKGAKGTLRIFEDSNWDNLYVGFIPDGYKLKFGDEEYTFAKTTGTEYRSDVVQYNSTNADKNVSVGVVDADGKYVATNHTQEMRHIFLNTGGASFWEADNVDNFALYDITNETFTCLMHKTGYPNIYEGWVPTTCEKIIFVRLKSSTINWGNIHNQTVDITLEAGKNLYTINNWNQSDNKSSGTWSAYERYGQFAMHDNSKSKNWYVHFVPHYVLKYDKNANDATGTMDVQTVAVDAADKKVIVADCGFTRPGYEFESWRKGETSTYFVAGVNHELVADVTFYAKWKAKKITITWDANGGSVNPTTSTYIYNGTPVELPTPTRSNYIFKGWYTATSGGTQIADVGTTNKPTDDVTYYAQWTAKATPTFAWSADSYTAALEADNTFPTLDNPNTLPVTYSSSDPSVATIDANGNITLVATGTTTITAAGAETDTHKSATDTYELTVVAANCKWVETTTIEDGDEVVMIMVDNKKSISYAMYNQKVTSTNPLAKEIDTDIFSSGNVPNEIIWDIHKDENGIVFYSKTASENYLRCNAAPNVRVSTGSNNTFALDKGYIKNLYYGTYLAVATGASTKDWRHYDYSSNNVIEQTLKLYKRECLDVTKVWVEGNLTNVTCEPQLPQQLAKDGSITLTFTAVDGYTLPDNVTVTNAPNTWNKSTGTLTISNPTNNVLITIEAVKLHTVTWMVGSSSVLTEEVANGTGVTQTPASTPEGDAIGDCADTFLGWSEKSAGSTPQDAAYYNDLCTAADMKSKHTSVTGDKTFYAVFATEEPSNTTTTSTTTISGDNSGTIDNVLSWSSSKNDGTAITAWNDNHFRLYPNKNNGNGSSITITPVSGVTISEVVLTATSTTYAKPVKYNIDGGSDISGTWSSTKMTISDINATSSFKFRNAYTGANNDQVRVTVSVTYSKGGTITTYSNYVTNCCATPVPTNGSYTSPSGTSVTLTWDGESTQYHITGEGLDDYTDDESYTITDLEECEEYVYYVSAYPEGGCESEAIAITAQPFSGAKTVTFNYNGNGQANTTSSTSCGNTSITLPTPSWTGYRFMGWFNAASGGTKIGEAGTSYTPTADITLFAHWEKEYNVTYNANGGSTTCAGGAYIAGETVTICTTNPSKTGHTFTGWTYSPEVTITDGKFTMPASDVTITAQWTINQYTVTWKPNGGNWGGSTANIVETYEYGATIVQPAAPQRDGYRFTGWSPAVSATMPAGNKTYTAQWKQNYTITFHDGNDVTPWTQTKDAESINLTEYVGTLACDDYQFAGWSTDATQYNDQTANITTWVTSTYTPTENIHLYAVYVKGDLATDFTLNCAGGVYEIWEKGHNQHMAGRQNGGGDKFYTTEYWDANNSESNGAPFTITKVADQTYTLQNADGQYITRDSYYEDELEIEETWENADRYKWTISNGTNGTWRFTNKAATSYALVYYDNRYFELRSASSVTAGNTTTYDLELTPAQTNVYQSNPNCGPYTITFETHGGEFVQGNYKYSTAVTTDLTESTISKFPSAELEGYTFAGWRDGNPQEDVNYEPYLKKQDDILVVSSNKTYHAVYYYYDEEEDIDWSEEFTTGIYAEVNGMKYFLAGAPSSGTMSSTTDCGYVSEVTITPGTGANAGKYKITVDGVGLAPESGETDLVEGTAWWTITETSAGSGEYKISGEDKRNIVLRNSSFGHYSYNAGSSYGAGYYYPRFGKCLEHHWTSDPPAKPSIKLSGEVYVTATNARGIMATSTLKVSAKQLNANEKVNITSNSNDVYFSTDRTVNFVKANKPLNTLPIKADANGAIDQEIYVHYKPSTEGNGTPASVVVSANLETPDPSVTDDQTIYVRNLPAKFVIAAKWDGHWYALPANCTSSQSPTEGLLITVDDMDNPQEAIAAPASAKFGLKSVYTSNSSDNRYETNGEKLVFVENVTEEPVLNQTLYNGSETSIQVYAKYENYHNSTNASRYEWIPTTTNLLDYTLTSAHTFTKSDGTPEVARTISLGNNGVFGTLLNDKSYNGEVRLLPATFYEPAQMQVLKWKANSVIVMYTGAETTATTQVGDNDKSDEQTLADQKLTHGIYELTTVQALTEYAGDELNIYIGRDKRVELEIPLIINGEVTAAANAHDVVILENSKLTADAETKYSYKDVYVYGGGKLAIPKNTELSVNNIILRAGGVATDGTGKEATYQHIYPQLELIGTLTSAVQNIRYEYVTDSIHWYHLVLPFDGSLASIHYPYEYYGDQVTLDNDGSWIIKRYDGATRATGNYDAWKDIEKDEPEATTVKAGHGYIYWGAPKKITVNGVYARPTWGIQRITMLSNVSETIAKATDAENDDKIISGLSSYENVENPSKNIYDQGWNLIGNPYMVNLTGLNGNSLKSGQLIEERDANGNWTGGWVLDSINATLRYITVPSDHFEWYEAKRVSKDMKLVSGRAFFVQIAGGATDIMFEASNRAQLMPALRAAHNDEPVDIETGIVLSSETMQDEVNFWISDGLTNDYEYNADYPKTPNNTNFNIYGVHAHGDLSWVATGPEFAKESMPIGYQVPAAGTYILSVSEDYYSEDLDALYVTDHEKSPELTVDLMSNPYEFSVNQAETNNTRFTVALRLKLDDDGTITGLENIGADNDALMKFIYQDKMYILHHGVIYDATGKRVTTINK